MCGKSDAGEPNKFGLNQQKKKEDKQSPDLSKDKQSVGEAKSGVIEEHDASDNINEINSEGSSEYNPTDAPSQEVSEETTSVDSGNTSEGSDESDEYSDSDDSDDNQSSTKSDD